ncbi:ATP-binding protein [Streptomyces prasinopilosus]|uniref:Anti-sigma regulatory factor (Ser/Thr protein kinase) n=1 Tax=Streptomyces prasinopilosus TaxID=67344 RepID=A0A1G6SSQ5_9ACTN|nr:ATP-binding protein [Streptomyces prasinopilosus]SDD19165.1 Anti-sigma regulatory factor (Ser/Thr protein kinase) [Streptomyces prasinopilosus]
MASESHRDRSLAAEEITERVAGFAGELHDVTDARLVAEGFLLDLARVSPPTAPEHWDDILLVVTELAANAVQYAPGPFRLRLRRTFDGVHVVMHDTSTTEPAPRPFRPSRGGGGIGWHLIHTLCDQVSVVGTADGKDIHVFLPW